MKELKERVLKEGKILSDDILKVDSFLNHQIDIELLDKIGQEFYELFKDHKIDKVLTIESSGIPMATFTAKYFKVPLVFAKKARSKNISLDVYSSVVHSYTYNNDYTITVSKEFLHEGENILIIDDFMANGKAVLGLIDICKQASVNIEGIGICIEKAYQEGNKLIREKGYNLKSLVRILKMSKEEGLVIE